MTYMMDFPLIFRVLKPISLFISKDAVSEEERPTNSPTTDSRHQTMSFEKKNKDKKCVQLIITRRGNEEKSIMIFHMRAILSTFMMNSILLVFQNSELANIVKYVPPDRTYCPNSRTLPASSHFLGDPPFAALVQAIGIWLPFFATGSPYIAYC